MYSFSELAGRVGNPFLQHIRLDAYSRLDKFRRYAAQVGYAGQHADYKTDVAQALRDLVLHLVRVGEAQTGGPVGICLRGLNDNAGTEALVRAMNLPKATVERIGWYGDENKGMTVRDAIRSRAHPDRSFLIPVTSKARMGDAFPRQVRYFIDLTQKSSTQNALLQGLLGRACGYGKDTLVVMSDDNTAYARAIAAGTPWALKPATHVKMVDARAGIRSTAQVVLRRGVETIAAYREKRLSEKDYLAKVTSVAGEVAQGKGKADVPGVIADNPDAQAYYRVLRGALVNGEGDPAREAAAAQAAKDIAILIAGHLIVDFWNNDEAQKGLINAIDDYFWDSLKPQGIELPMSQLDDLTEEVLRVARARTA